MKSCNTIISEKPAQEVFNTGSARRVTVGSSEFGEWLSSFYKSLGEEMELRGIQEAEEEKARREAKKAEYAERDQEYLDRCSERGDLRGEIYFGSKPVLESHAKAVNELLHPDDIPLYWHVHSKERRIYKKNKTGLISADAYFRRNKPIGETNLLRKSKFQRIVDAGLMKLVVPAKVRENADLYTFTPLALRLEADSIPQTFSEYMSANLVNPVTGKIYKTRQLESIEEDYNAHDLNHTPERVAALARRCERGLRIDLTSIYQAQFNRKNSDEYRSAIETPLEERTKEQVSLLTRAQSDDYNLLGVRINGTVELLSGEAILFQAFKPTSTGRLALRDGGFLNLSSELKEIGLQQCSVTQYRYDLKAAQVNLFLAIADSIGVTIPDLDKYASQKSYRDELAQAIGFGCTGADVKQAIIDLVMCSALPTPAKVRGMIGKYGAKAIADYSFVRDFFELGGVECYERAYAALEPIISGANQVQDYLYDDCLNNRAYQHKGKLWVKNAAGCKRAFWDYKTKKPLNSKGKEIEPVEAKRKLVAYLLQGLEQELIQEIVLGLDDSYLVWYEHDGFITNKALFWEKRGRMELEYEVVGGYVAEEPVEEIESFTDLSELPVVEIEQPAAPIVEEIEPLETEPTPEVVETEQPYQFKIGDTVRWTINPNMLYKIRAIESGKAMLLLEQNGVMYRLPNPCSLEDLKLIEPA